MVTCCTTFCVLLDCSFSISYCFGFCIWRCMSSRCRDREQHYSFYGWFLHIQCSCVGLFARHLGSNSIQIFRIMSPWISETSGKMERSRMGTSAPLEPLEHVSMFTEHPFVAWSMWRYRYRHQGRERCWWKWRRPASILSIGEYRMGYWSIFYLASFLTSQVSHSTHRLRLINCSSCSTSNLSVNNREQ